jgi:hypothetical protein
MASPTSSVEGSTASTNADALIDKLADLLAGRGTDQFILRERAEV